MVGTQSSPAPVRPQFELTGLTVLIGREAQLAELANLAREARLITLLGPGGAGKSRLLMELGSSLAGLLLGVVRLDSLPPGSEIGQRVAQALLLEPGEDPSAQVLRALRGRDGVLLLDNCEHVLGDCALTCESILRACPGMTIVASSREPLGVGGEVRYLVPPLALPPGAADLAAIRRSPAVRLFEARAQLVLPGFAISVVSAPAVAAICQHLEGLPLAIELAAASLALMPVDEVLHRLTSRLGLPGEQSRPPRQRSLGATLDWSYELLSDPERAMFRRLAIFAGGFDLEAVEAVTPGGPVEPPVLDVFAGLVAKSLVAIGPGSGGRARYRLLLPVREYAQARLESNRERAALARAHALHYLLVIEREGPGSGGGDGLASSRLGRLALEEDNFRVALGWLAEHDPPCLARAVAGLSDHWTNRGGIAEGRRWFELALRALPVPLELRADLLLGAGHLAWRAHDFAAARSMLEESLAIARELDEPALLGRALGGLGFVLFGSDDSSAAVALLAEELALARAGGDAHQLANALNNSAILALHQDDHAAALVALEECLAVLERAGAPSSLRSIPIGLLGRVHTRTGELVRARTLLQQALSLRVAEGTNVLIASALDYMGELAAAMGQSDRALTLFGISDRLYAEGGASPPSLAVASRERGLSLASRRLGPAAARLRAAGSLLDREEALAFALSGEGVPPAPRRGSAVLSGRELEVARLVADGLTNRQVAEMLSISVRTVGAHLEHAREKLGVHSRAEIASWLARRP